MSMRMKLTTVDTILKFFFHCIKQYHIRKIVPKNKCQYFINSLYRIHGVYQKKKQKNKTML